MHIYIRTGENENTGIEFIDGTEWEEMGSLTGFKHYPSGSNEPVFYTLKSKDSLNNVPFGDRGLAALAVASHELENLNPLTEIDSLTWIRSNSPLIHDLKQLFSLGGDHPVGLLSEIQETLNKYLRINTPGGQTKIIITSEDLARVELDSEQRIDETILLANEPQGFTVTSEDGNKVTHFTVPELLRTTVYNLPDEQRYLAILYLAAEKLRNLPSDTTIHQVAFQAEAVGYGALREEDSNDVFPELKTHPVEARELRDRLLNIVAAYTE